MIIPYNTWSSVTFRSHRSNPEFNFCRFSRPASAQCGQELSRKAILETFTGRMWCMDVPIVLGSAISHIFPPRAKGMEYAQTSSGGRCCIYFNYVFILKNFQGCYLNGAKMPTDMAFRNASTLSISAGPTWTAGLAQRRMMTAPATPAQKWGAWA